MEIELDLAIPNPKDPELTLPFLPKNWALQKPLADYPVEIVDKLFHEDRIIASKKYNGHRIHVLINKDGEPVLYNRTSKDILNDFVPELVREISSSGLPPNSLFDGEVYIPSNKKESLEELQAVITCGDPKLGAEREKSIQPSIALFDTLVLNKQNLILQPYQLRQSNLPTGGRFHPVQQVAIQSRDEGMKLVIANSWEGLVLWDKRSPHKLNTLGNTKRGGCYKLLRDFEEDFVAIGFKEGSGQGKGMVGTLQVGKFDNGIFVPFGEVGSGLSIAQKQELINPTLYPIVVAVKHFGLDTQGRVTLPKIVKIHKDKLPNEVQIA